MAELEKRFHKQKYLASAERAALARGLKMTDAQVSSYDNFYKILIKNVFDNTITILILTIFIGKDVVSE